MSDSPDMVNQPGHYTKDGGIECIEAIKASMSSAAFNGYLKGNVMKYIWRYENKNKLEDLQKATGRAKNIRLLQRLWVSL